MLFKVAGETERGSDFNPSKGTNDHNMTAGIALTGRLDQANYIAARIIDKEDLLKRAFEVLIRWGGLIHGDSNAECACRYDAFASWRNHSIVIAAPSLSDIFGSTPSNLRILVLSGTRRGMSS